VRREHGLGELLGAETKGLADEICTEIRRGVPEYAAPGRGALGPAAMRPAVEQALATFMLRVTDPSAPTPRMMDTCRRLGRIEAQHGRSLNALQSAFRIAFRVAWRRTTKICASHRLPAETVAELAEAQLEFMDELASVCVAGYADANARSPEELAELRGKLLRRVLERPAASRRAIADLAERAGWTIPAEVTVVVARARGPVLAALSDDVLTDLDVPQPRLLIPGPFTADRRAMAEAALPDDRFAVGVTVPLEEAADSFRWAARVLALAEGGVVEAGRVMLCEDHLLTLWLMSDPRLIEELAGQRLAGLTSMSPAKQKALTETLRVWLESWSTAAEVGGRLHVHPQTVRYRLNQLKETMGDRFTDPDARFGLELVLRAMRLRDRAARVGENGRRVIGEPHRPARSKAS
jgi:PucR C-terminal helix-turn-helix domain